MTVCVTLINSLYLDGIFIFFSETGELEMIPGGYSKSGPKCMLKLGDGARAGRCLDVESERTQPGGLLHVYPCVTKWHQLFSFGNGTIAPRGGIHASLPLYIVRQLESKKKNVTGQLCLGVRGRGDMDESLWHEEEEEEEGEEGEEEHHPWEQPDVPLYPNGRKSLQLWNGQQLQTTPCSNIGGIIEWYYVPFIVEEYDDKDEELAVNVDALSTSTPDSDGADLETKDEAMTETDEEL